MSHIFISYSHKDKEYVEKLEQKLIEEGFNVWIDHRIDYGSQWPKEIQRQLDACDAFIVVITEYAFESKWVQNEVARAGRKGKPFFPLLLKGDPWLSVEATQYVDVRNGLLPPEKFYKRLEKVTPRKKVETTVQFPPDIKPKRKIKLPKLSIDSKIAVRVVGVLFVGLIVFWGFSKLADFIGQIQFPTSEPKLIPTRTQVIYPTSTPDTVIETPTVTSVPNATSTLNAMHPLTTTSTPELGIGSTWTRPADGMVMMYVPAGEFQMGSEEGDEDEKPVHTVYLDSFWMDQTEVTNKMYSQCVQDGLCYSSVENSRNANHPVTYISWEAARTYCEWAGARMPTEAEWEKASRGTDGRTYPWGEGVDCDKANYSGCVNRITEVGIYENGRSVFGLYDMADNVWEWVVDWYDDEYYSNSPASNPLGPEIGNSRVVRGGAWQSSGASLRSADRYRFDPTTHYHHVSFRCARSVIP